MSTKATEMTLEALRSVPLFASLNDAAATELRESADAEDVAAGTQLFHKGDTGNAMYLIETRHACASALPTKIGKRSRWPSWPRETSLAKCLSSTDAKDRRMRT